MLGHLATPATLIFSSLRMLVELRWFRPQHFKLFNIANLDFFKVGTAEGLELPWSV